MSARVLPKLTPSCVTAGKEQSSVIIEFPRDLPKDVLVTFDFCYESTAKRLATVPAVALGPRTVRANFPEFPKPGEVEIIVKLAREESSLFPKFKFHVQSPAEAIYHSIPTSKEANRIPLLASILAYLLNSDVEKDRDVRSHTDVILCNILQLVNRQEMPDWNLASLLCGSHGLEENLLHFCMRRKLDGMAELLLQPRLIEGKVQVLRQRSHDSKTPADIARKNGMKRICDQMEMMAGKSEHKKGKQSSQEQKQKKKHKVKKSASADVQSVHSIGDVGPLPLSIPKGGKKKRRLTGISRIKSVFAGKDAHVISPPQPPGVEPEFSKSWSVHSAGSATEDLLESPILRSGSNRLHAPYPLPERPRSYTTADPSSAAETSALSIRKLRAFSVPSESDLENVPMKMRTSDGDLITSMTPEEDENVDDDGVESSLVSALGTTALSAIQELKRKCLYTAVVTRQYRWAASPYGDFVLHVGDKVYVTQELEGNMCLGVCNDCYGKFPESILRMLSEEEERTLGIQDDIHPTSDSDESDLYDSVEDVGIYKVPRSLPCLLDSDSDEHTYDVPPNAAELIGSVTDSEQPEGRYKKVPIRQKTFRVSRQRISSHLRSPMPGRLLSSYAHASSHDTGLDRLGIPRSKREDARQSKTVTLHAALARTAAAVDESLSEDDTWGNDIPSYTMDVTSGPPDSTDESQDAMDRGSEGQSASSLQPSGGGYSASDSECYDDVVVKKPPKRTRVAKGRSSESEPAGDSPEIAAQERSVTPPEIDPISDQNADPVESSRPQGIEAAAQQTDHTVHLPPHHEHPAEPHLEAEGTVEQAMSPEHLKSAEKQAGPKKTTPEASPQHRIKRLLPTPPTIATFDATSSPGKTSPLLPVRSPPSPLVAHETKHAPPLAETTSTSTPPIEERVPPLPEKPQKAVPPPPPPLTEEELSPPEIEIPPVPPMKITPDGDDTVSTATPPTNPAETPPVPEKSPTVPPRTAFLTSPVSPTQTKAKASPSTPEGSPVPARRTLKPRVAPVPKPRRQIPPASVDVSPPVSRLEISAPTEERASPQRHPSIPRKPEPPPTSPKPNRKKLIYNAEKKDE